MANLSADLEEIRRAVSLFFVPDAVVELRVPKAGFDKTLSGYFSDPEKLALAARQVNGKGPGVYITLNPVRSDVRARADGRVKPRAENTTRDPEITCRRWLLLDFDPIRPAGLSSTEMEHSLAIHSAKSTSELLAAEGWPFPVCADSGNGGHLLYRIDLPNDEESATLVANVLKGAAVRFGSPGVIDLDLTVFNASRISKLYGTVAQKGDSTSERPHRLSRVLSRPDVLEVVSIEQLQALAGAAPDQPARPQVRPQSTPYQWRDSGPQFNLEQWLLDHGVRIERGPVMHQGSEKWVLENCPFNPEHAAPDAAIFRQPSGRLGFKCLHASCAGKDWTEFREFYEPQRPRGGGNPAAPFIPVDVVDPPRATDAGDTRDKISSSAAEVEEAAAAAIAADDLVAAMRLATGVAALRPLDRAVIIAKLKEHFGRRFLVREFNQALKDAAGDAGGVPPPEEPEEPTDGDGPDLRFFPRTDSGNGERIVAMFGSEIRYCVEMKRWLVWDGKRWAIDEFNVMRQRAKAVARKLFIQARGDEGLQAHARGSEMHNAITNALAMAQTEKGIPVSAAELDQHPFLLNCPNGVIDLRDGSLLRHNRNFLITKLCPVPYDPKAVCPKFVEWLQWAMGCVNPEAEITDKTANLVGFLQKAFGYALTSDVGEKAVFIFYGKTGNNGKTTLLTTFRKLLGKDYSGELVIDTVMSMKSQDSTARADLADLRGVRLVVTSEVEKEHRLSEGKIKYLTAGMGSIKSRRLYENPIEFPATHKLFMDCNHRPVVRGVDDAIWNRLKAIPFDSTVAKEDIDKQLPEKLQAEFPGILAWAVRGCIQWRKTGLGNPPEVSKAGEEWREHDDPLKEFLDDWCQMEDGLYVKSVDLSAAYETWAKQQREKFPLGREAFNERLQAKGLGQSRSRRMDGKQARTWEGISLRPEVSSALRKTGALASAMFAETE